MVLMSLTIFKLQKHTLNLSTTVIKNYFKFIFKTLIDYNTLFKNIKSINSI